MANSSVSVAMATFNGARYLQQQLTDIAVQSVLPSELVVCDDGSTDDTLAILTRFAANAPFAVRVHRNEERLGYRANFLRCAGLCRSDLIAFSDQDDRWLPGKVEAMLACFDDPGVLLAFHGAEILGHDETPLGRLRSMPRPIGATPPLGGSPWMFGLGFTQVFRRWLCDCDRWWELSFDQNTTTEPLAHDQWYFFLASTLGTVVHVEAPLVGYRQHAGNVFGWSTAKQTLRARILDRVGSAGWSLDSRSQSATQRAVVLDLVAGMLGPPYRQRALEGAISYRQLAAICAYRAAIYAESTVGARLRSFARLVSARGYGGDTWRFGAKALAMDVTVGLPGLLQASFRRAKGRAHAARVTTS